MTKSTRCIRRLKANFMIEASAALCICKMAGKNIRRQADEELNHVAWHLNWRITRDGENSYYAMNWTTEYQQVTAKWRPRTGGGNDMAGRRQAPSGRTTLRVRRSRFALAQHLLRSALAIRRRGRKWQVDWTVFGGDNGACLPACVSSRISLLAGGAVVW